MFDFSGTVFRIEPCADWLRGALDSAGVEASEEEIAYWAGRLEQSGAQPGGATLTGWMPDPAADKARSAHPPKAAAKTVAIEGHAANTR